MARWGKTHEFKGRQRGGSAFLLYTSIGGTLWFSLFFKGPITWNKIPPYTLASFKKAWKQFLIVEVEVG